MSLLFSEYQLQSPQGPLRLPNRVVVAPMCQYSAHEGEASDWHLMHWGNLLNSGAGLFMIEATAVSPEGRITPYCLGLWNQKTQTALEDKLVRKRHQRFRSWRVSAPPINSAQQKCKPLFRTLLSRPIVQKK